MNILNVPGKAVNLYECSKCRKNFIFDWECKAHEEKCLGNIINAYSKGLIK